MRKPDTDSSYTDWRLYALKQEERALKAERELDEALSSRDIFAETALNERARAEKLERELAEARKELALERTGRDTQQEVTAKEFSELRSVIEAERAARQAAEAREAVLRNVLARVEPNIGWRSMQGDDSDQYYCEFCGAQHHDSREIPHHDECLVAEVRQALATTGRAPEEREDD